MGDPSATCDVVVVGNGSVGMSLGLVLARRSLRVAVVGESARPWAASAAAGAMNGCFGEVTPQLLRSEVGRLKLEMDFRATALWTDWEQALLEESDETAIRTAHGTTVILNTIGVHDIDTGGYEAIRTALEEYKEPYEEVDPASLDWLDPVPTSRPLRAMHIPGEHAVDSPALLTALETAIRRRGGTLIDDLVTEVVVSAGRATGVRFASGRSVAAGQVVLAAGAHTTGLLDCLPPDVRALIPPVVAGRGVALMVRTVTGAIPTGVIRTPNRAFACGLHVVPRGDGLIYLGATNEVERHPGTSAAIGELNLLLGGTRQLRADLNAGWVERTLIGNRPIPLDGFPLLGSTGLAGLWLMTGTYRDGLHQSPLLATHMADLILDGPGAVGMDLSVFTPIRPPIQAMTRDECLATAVLHTMGTAYEHDWKIMEDWPPMIEEHFRSAFTTMLDRIDSAFVPPPEMLFFADEDIHELLLSYYAAHENAATPAEDR